MSRTRTGISAPRGTTTCQRQVSNDLVFACMIMLPLWWFSLLQWLFPACLKQASMRGCSCDD